jgi:hypothetical protein
VLPVTKQLAFVPFQLRPGENLRPRSRRNWPSFRQTWLTLLPSAARRPVVPGSAPAPWAHALLEETSRRGQRAVLLSLLARQRPLPPQLPPAAWRSRAKEDAKKCGRLSDPRVRMRPGVPHMRHERANRPKLDLRGEAHRCIRWGDNREYRCLPRRINSLTADNRHRQPGNSVLTRQTAHHFNPPPP